MKNENWSRTLLFFLSLTSFILTFLLYKTNTRHNKFVTTYKLETDSLQILTDSLREVNFILNIELGRHEVSREEVLGKYPKVNKEYQKFYKYETE